MSLSWPEPPSVGLCPERLVLRRGGATRVVPVTPAPGAPPWRAAVDALPGALGAARAASVILSHRFVHYALLPWSAALAGEDAWLAYARHRFATVYGSAAAGWTLRVAPAPRRQPRVACAVDAGLLDALRGARAASVQPHLMAAFNRVRRRLRRASCWLVVEETDRFALALIERGTWRALRSRHRESLPGLLARESALLGLGQAPPPLVVSAMA